MEIWKARKYTQPESQVYNLSDKEKSHKNLHVDLHHGGSQRGTG